MTKPPLPANEAARLAALRRLDLLDTEQERDFDDLTALAAEVLDVPVALVSLVDEDRQFLKSRHGLDVTQTSRDVSFCAHAINAPGELFVVPDAAADERFADNPLVTGGPGIRFYAGAVLVDEEGHALGTLCAIDSKPRELTEQQARALRALSRQAMRLIDLRREEARLRERAADLDRLSLIVNVTDSAAMITDAQGHIQYCNPAFTRISGYTAEEAMGHKPGHLLQGEGTDPQTVAFMRSRVAAGEPFEAEVLNYHKNGTAYWLSLEVRPVRDAAGTLTNFIAIERDVTAQKNDRAALERANALLRGQQEASADGILVVDEHNRVISMNRRFVEVWDLGHLGEIERPPFTDEFLRFIVEHRVADGPAFLERVKSLYADRTATAREEISLKDGRVLDRYTAPLHLDSGEYVGRIWYFRDVSEAKRAEAALREKDRRFRRIAANLPGVLVQYQRDPAGRGSFTYVSEGIRDTLGVEPESVTGDAAAMLSHFCPRDLPKLAAAMEASARDLSPFEHRARWVRPDTGEVRHVHIRTRPELQADGTIIWDGFKFDITEQRLAEYKLRENDRRFQRIAANTPGVLYQYRLEADGQTQSFPFVSDGVREVYGLEPEEVLADASLLFSIVDPADAPVLAAKVAESARGLTPIEWQGRIVRRDGGERHLKIMARPERQADGATLWDGLLLDVTEQHHAEVALKESEERFARIAANVPGMVYRFEMPADGPPRFTYVSDGCREVYGLEPEAIVADAGQLNGRIHAADLDGLIEATRRAAQSGLPVEWVGRHLPRVAPGQDASALDAGEDRKWISLCARSSPDDRGGLVTDGVVFDVSALKQAEERARLAQDLAEAASLAKSQFLANMSHEIRTPLNGVIGMTDLLLRRGLAQEHRRYAETIKGSANALLSLINDVLDFSKIEAGKLELSPTSFAVREVVEDVGQMLAGRAAERGLELACVVDPAVPATAFGDADRLRQVTINLLNNALKFTERGEVVLRVRPDEDAQGGNGLALRFEVSDTGIGIPPDRLDRLFKSFSQVDASTTRRFGGTGLGLAISKQLVTLMGGQVGVRSTPGVGSTFWFTVRFDAAGVAETQATTGRAGHDMRGLRVLVADDHAASLESLRDQMLAWSFEVSVARDGGEALAALRAAAVAGRAFDAAVLDMNMPVLGGVDVARLAKADPATAGVPLLMLTGADGEFDAAAARRAGFADCLVKPARQSQLFDAIARLTRGETVDKPVPATPAPATAGAAGRRLLVAEDNEVNQIVAGETLRDAGYEVVIVGNGRLAFEAVEAGGYDLVLMDCQMPEMDGFEATAAIRAAEAKAGRPRLGIVALTANAISGDRERCLEAGMDDYVTKPIDPDVLLSTVAKRLKAKETPAEARDVPPQADAATLAGGAIDVAALLKRCRGKRPLAATLLETFAKSAAAQVETVLSAAAGGDATALGRAAHAVKGSAANLSAEPLRLAAADLERQSAAGQASADTLIQVGRLVDEVEDCVLFAAFAAARLRDTADATATSAAVTAGQAKAA